MGKCALCGESAGLFKKEHEGCRELYKTGWASMVNTATEAILTSNLDPLEGQLSETAKASQIPAEMVHEALIQGWEQAVAKFLEDAFLSTEEDQRLVAFKNRFNLDQGELNRNGALSRSGWASMVGRATEALAASNLDSLEGELSETAKASLIPVEKVREALVLAWEQVVAKSLEDGILSAEEERPIVAFKNRFNLDQGELNRNGALLKMAKAATLRDVTQGKVPHHMELDGQTRFNLQKGESLVWLFGNSAYRTEKQSTVYQGGSAGVSVRVMKGVYLRTSQFRGHPVVSTSTVQEDVGVLGVTNKNVYFAGQRKAFRIPFAKIVALQPYSDGVGIQKDGATAKPMTFTTDDGCFAYNLISQLSHLEEATSSPGTRSDSR